MGWVHDIFSEYAVMPTPPAALHIVAADRDWNEPDRVTKLEHDLARANLLLQALTEAALRKGVVSREDIERAAKGIGAHKRQQEEAAPEQSATPEEFLSQLERQEG